MLSFWFIPPHPQRAALRPMCLVQLVAVFFQLPFGYAWAAQALKFHLTAFVKPDI